MKPDNPDKALIIIFAKAPVAGKVKTRLHAILNPEQAAALHQSLVEKTVSRLVRNKLYDVECHCAPDCTHGFFLTLKKQYRIGLQEQQGADLGQRMSHAMNEALKHYRKVILIGTDAPGVDQDYIQKALNALDDDVVVIGPAEDGGYVLIGMSRYYPEIFEEIEWGSAQVLRQTRERLDESEAQYALLETLWDIDRPEDWERYQREIGNS